MEWILGMYKQQLNHPKMASRKGTHKIFILHLGFNFSFFFRFIFIFFLLLSLFCLLYLVLCISYKISYINLSIFVWCVGFFSSFNCISVFFALFASTFRFCWFLYYTYFPQNAVLFICVYFLLLLLFLLCLLCLRLHSYIYAIH